MAGAPPQLAADLVDPGDDRWWVAGPRWSSPVGNRQAGRDTDGGQDFTYGVTTACPDVVDAGGGRVAGDQAVGVGEVVDVDVVADRGAVRGRPAVTGHHEGLAGAGGPQRQGNEVGGALVAEAGAAGPGALKYRRATQDRS
jgi:hypothetical protein